MKFREKGNNYNWLGYISAATEGAELSGSAIPEKKEKLEEKKVKKFEKSKEKQKIEICKKIFTWKEEFLKSETGASFFSNNGKRIWVYGGNWAHGLKRYGFGCWSRIYFNDKTIEYVKGYKWMGSGTMYKFKKPEEMAKKLHYKYLKDFLGEIESEKIFGEVVRLNG